MCPSNEDVIAMARAQALADEQPLKNLMLDANVKSREDIPKLWAYLRNRQTKEEEDIKKKEEEMMIAEMEKTQSASALETQDIFDQLLNMETQDDALEAIFSELGAPGPSPQAGPQQAALPPQGPPVASQSSAPQLVAPQPGASPPKQQVVPVQQQVVPPSTSQHSAGTLDAPQPWAPPPVLQVVPVQHEPSPRPAPQVSPQCSALQAPQQGQAAGHGQEQPPQQAQSPCGQAQGNGAQEGTGTREGTGAITTLAVKDVTNPSKEAKNDYRAFIRGAQNRDKFPVGLQAAFKADKVDLFNIWRRNGKNWGKSELAVKRSAAKLTESVGEKRLVKVRDLVRDGMPLERALSLREKRKRENLCVADADFPDVEDEIQFWHTTKVAASTINRTEESMSVTATADVDGAELEDLVGDEGILCAGLHVAAPGVSNKNQMAFAEGLANLVTNEGTGKLKLTAKPKEPQSTTDVPVLTPKQIALGVCEDIQKEIKEAHNLEMVLTVP